MPDVPISRNLKVVVSWEIAHLHDLPSKLRACAGVVVAALLLAMTEYDMLQSIHG
jgi:hypothetical protein